MKKYFYYEHVRRLDFNQNLSIIKFTKNNKKNNKTKNNMENKLKFEAVIIICASITAVILNELITAKALSALALFGGIVGIAFFLFIMTIFASISIHGLPDDRSVRTENRIFYVYIGAIPLITMVVLFTFGAEPIIIWITICVLWYLASAFRIAVLWDWF